MIVVRFSVRVSRADCSVWVQLFHSVLNIWAVRSAHNHTNGDTSLLLQIDLEELLGTGKFSKFTTAARPLARSQGPTDDNFEDAVTSFVYRARAPFHPQRLYKFLTQHFDLHQRDWSADVKRGATDALKTVLQASRNIQVCSHLNKSRGTHWEHWMSMSQLGHRNAV